MASPPHVLAVWNAPCCACFSGELLSLEGIGILSSSRADTEGMGGLGFGRIFALEGSLHFALTFNGLGVLRFTVLMLEVSTGSRT